MKRVVVENADLIRLADIEERARDIETEARYAKEAAALIEAMRTTAAGGRASSTTLVDDLGKLLVDEIHNRNAEREKRALSALRSVISPIADDIFKSAALILTADAALKNLRAQCERDVVASAIVSVMP